MKTQLAIGAALAAAVVLGATIVAFSNAQGDNADQHKRPTGLFAAAQEDEIRAIVREYLLDNPEVIIESLQAYDMRRREASETQARDNARANLAALLDDAGGFSIASNPAKATVAVIELFDYHCGYCKRATPLMQDLTRRDASVRVVFRELPILREESEFAARAALAARAQGKYVELHFAMMRASGVLDMNRIREIAGANGLDADALLAAMDDPALEQAIDDNHRIAAEIGVDGTPAFIVASLDGSYVEVVPGFSEPRIKAAIENAKKAAKKK